MKLNVFFHKHSISILACLLFFKLVRAFAFVVDRNKKTASTIIIERFWIIAKFMILFYDVFVCSFDSKAVFFVLVSLFWAVLFSFAIFELQDLCLACFVYRCSFERCCICSKETAREPQNVFLSNQNFEIRLNNENLLSKLIYFNSNFVYCFVSEFFINN